MKKISTDKRIVELRAELRAIEDWRESMDYEGAQHAHASIRRDALDRVLARADATVARRKREDAAPVANVDAEIARLEIELVRARTARADFEDGVAWSEARQRGDVAEARRIERRAEARHRVN